MKLGRASSHENLVGDETSSHISKSLSVHTAFPELQRLPKNARLPIRKFIQEYLSNFQGEKNVSRKTWPLAVVKTMAKAVKEQDDDGKDEDIEKENFKAGQYNVLHIACVVGNCWLVKLQIEAGVDLSALDQHSWTALMIATALGHTSCAELLSEHMETRKVKAAPQTFPPSAFGLFVPKNLLITHKILKDPCNKPKFFYSDHPIPPHFQTFYYEITILSSSNDLGCVYVGATELLYTNSSF